MRERGFARHAADPSGPGPAPADPMDRLCAALGDREAVLILDNCEQVVNAAARLADRILAECPAVRILATSREPLRIQGETLWVVSPLAIPPGPPADLSDTHAYPAVRLFRDRAFAVLPSFTLDGGNAAAVARICRALDGLPLAIELAVVWLRTLTPAQLAERLDDRFALLTGGSRTALPRHQTLRAVVDWSWDLLSEPERVLARRLAVFPGGATLTAVEQVCSDASLPGASTGLARAAVLPALSGLVGKSIIVADSRYRMLETVRAYAAERLAEAGEEAQVKDALTAYYLKFAETADPLLRSAEQVRWFRELTAEQDNAHAALRWAITRRDADTALRLVRALGYYWVQRGHGEGDTLARDTLALESPPLTSRRIAEARAICALLAAGWSWDIESIRAPLTQAIAALARWSAEYETFHPIAALVEPLLAQFDGAHERALAIFERYASARDPWLRAMGRLYCASYGSTVGRLDGAEEACREALGMFRELGEMWGTAITLTQLAEFVELRADHAASIAALEEAAALGRELGSWGDMSYVEGRLAVVRARAGEIARARADLDRVEREAAERGRHSDTDHWVAFQRAELAWREEDLAGVTRCCLAILGTLDNLSAPWWQSLRAQVKARLAMVALRQADLPRCQDLLGEALRSVTAWVEHPALAVVLDAVAAYVLARGGDGAAELAATLLGAAHGIRGAFDESSLDAPPARAAARAALGTQAFGTAYAQGRQLGYEAALACARDALTEAASR
jgi:predicted ATPase